MLLDSGSGHSVVGLKTAQRNNFKIEPLNEDDCANLYSVSDEEIKMLGAAEVIIEISGLKFPHRILISENLGNHFILGRQFLMESQQS